MVKDDEESLIQDAFVIGKAMLDSIRKMAAEQNRPLCDFTQGSIQALIVVNGILLESDPFISSLKE